MAGSPCPVEVMKACIDRMHMGEVTICYGMTETSPVSTQTLPDDSLHHRTATVGRVASARRGPHRRRRRPGVTLERGETGELCTRGYSVMLGYWNDPERTAEAIDADGWMHTGDLAVMDDDGYVNIVGRIKDMVIRGGENVYPREVEEFLYTHPAIEDVQVVGVPDERYGEELLAAVRLHPGADGDRGGDPRLLPRPHRPLQGAALRHVRRRVPDDRGGSGPVITRSCDWLACTHVVGPRAMPTWSMVPSQSPSRNTRSPALIGWLQKSTARPRRACAAAWWISDTPTREYAAMVSPEQSNAPGPAVKNT